MARKKVIQPKEGVAQEGPAETENKPKKLLYDIIHGDEGKWSVTESEEGSLVEKLIEEFDNKVDAQARADWLNANPAIDAKFEVVKSPSLAELESAVEAAWQNVSNASWEWAKAITAIHDSGLYPHAGETDGFYLYMEERWRKKKAMTANYLAWVKDETKQQMDDAVQQMLGEGKINTLETPPPDKPLVGNATQSRAERKQRKEKSTDPLAVKKRVMGKIKAAQKVAKDTKNPDFWLQDLGGIIDERTVEQLVWYMKGILSLQGMYANETVKWVIPRRVPGAPWKVVQMEVSKALDEGCTLHDTEAAAQAALRALEPLPEAERLSDNSLGTETLPPSVPDQEDAVNRDSETTEYSSLESLKRSFRGWLPEEWEILFPTDVLTVVIDWAKEQDLEGTNNVLAAAWEEVSAEWERMNEATKNL